MWHESGYFDTAAESKPLLHLWSLGIEEQFYIVWPFFLWFAWKARWNLLIATLVLGSISFLVNIGIHLDDTVAAFYSPANAILGTARGLGIGLRDAFKNGNSANVMSLAPNVQALCGVTLIAFGILVITREQAFPGWWAIVSDSWRGFSNFRRVTSLAESQSTLKQGPGLVWFDKLSALPLALAITRIREDCGRRGTLTKYACCCCRHCDWACMVDVCVA